MHLRLSAERGLLFRITHVANVPGLLAEGLHCANGASSRKDFVPIGNVDLISKRAQRLVPIEPGGTLADYVPFYFTPRSPMLYNIKTGYGGITKRNNDEIAILFSSYKTIRGRGVRMIFTDRHAYTSTATWSDRPEELSNLIDWDILQRSDFSRNDSYPDKMERYQAEALAHQYVPANALLGIGCASQVVGSDIEASIKRLGSELPVFVRPGWYF